MKLFSENKMLTYTDQVITDWQHGVQIGSQLLIDNGYVNKDYVNKIITTTNELGPYYIIAPQIALLHVNPDDSIVQNAISFTYFKNPIVFKQSSRYHVNFCLALAAKDSHSHINILQAVAQLFSQQVFLNELNNCYSTAQLIKTVQKYDQ